MSAYFHFFLCGRKAAEWLINMNFKDLLLRAKSGDNEALTELLLMYRPLLLKESIVDGVFDEDLFQELCIVFLKCVRKFRV